MDERFVEAAARTWIFDLLTAGSLPPDVLCIANGDVSDARGDLPVWRDIERCHPERVVRLSGFQRDECVAERAGGRAILRLRSEISLNGLLQSNSICIDITSLPLAAWAPLIRAALEANKRLWVVYAEPLQYAAHKSPTPPDLFDLSERVADVEALPGLARLLGPPLGTPLLLTVFLGFEGGRARHVATTLDPEPKVIPVIGVPGMRPEYASQAVECNREFLANSDAYRSIRWADAVCPFGVADLLAEIAAENPDRYMYIAPIGTKPHALGSLLYSLRNADQTQIIYDFPVPKLHGTFGIGPTYLYRVN